MRWIAAVVVIAALGIINAARSSATETQASQDYRAGQLALRTGWMSFGQLWFASGR